MIAHTPAPPYYAVIFTSIQTESTEGYAQMAELMESLVVEQDGFLGVESARNDVGITVSYWKDLESIQRWKAQTQHEQAQKKGKSAWYAHYKVRIAKVERDYAFDSPNE